MLHNKTMRVKIHRGSNEIGGSCVEIESADVRIIVDAGMPLNLPTGQDPVSPEIDSESLCAIVISHPHLDHYGLLPWLPAKPVIMGIAARRIAQAAAPFMQNLPTNLSGPDLEDRKPIQIGPFKITPYLVDHSAYDAYALLIEADNKKLFYSGDFRAHGRKSKLFDWFISSPPTGVDTLLLEGTTISRNEPEFAPLTEDDLENKFVDVFKSTKGLALVNVSAQNIDRMVTIFSACLKTGRSLVIDLYTAEILAATENLNIPQSHWEKIHLCIPYRQRIQIKKNNWFAKLKKHSINRIFPEAIAAEPNRYTLIFRSLWMADLDKAECLDGATLIHSQWEGYLRHERFQAIEKWREAHGISFHQVHTSGHASPADLSRFAAAISAKALVPIHTNSPESYDELYSNVIRHPDGEWWNV